MTLPTIRFDPSGLGRPLVECEERITNGEARLDAEGRARYERAKRDGYYFGNTEVDAAAWLADYWLGAMALPMIRIEKRGSRAKVIMDLISCPRKISNLWDGCQDHERDWEMRKRDASTARHDAEDSAELAGLTSLRRPLDAASARQVAEICARARFGKVVRWQGHLVRYDGISYRSLGANGTKHELEYAAWKILSRLSRHGSRTAYVGETKKIVQAIKDLTFPVVEGDPPQWIDRHSGDPDATSCVVHRDGILDLRTGKILPDASRLFATRLGVGDHAAAIARAVGGKVSYFGVYTVVEKIPNESAPEVARSLRSLWDLIALAASRLAPEGDAS